MSGDKSVLTKVLGAIGRVLPGDYCRTFFYLNLVKTPRTMMRKVLNSFYRMDHIFDVIEEFKHDYAGRFSILEFGVADGYSFRKMLFATRYLKMDDRITVHGFDTFEGMPPTRDERDGGLIRNDEWREGQFKADFASLESYCHEHYRNYVLHKGLFEQTLTTTFLERLIKEPAILIWMDADYYTSTVGVLRKLVPYIPSGCVIYFDEPEFNFGSRFTGESRAIDEINSGAFGDGIELVRDGQLSLDSERVYRFINTKSKAHHVRVQGLTSTGGLRPPTNDSPLP